MIFFRFTSYILAVFITINFSCSKKKETTSQLSTKEILMASQWKYSSYKENGVTMPFFASCEMNDVLSFLADDNYHIVRGDVNCNAYCNCNDFYFIDPDNKTMRWGLLGSGEISFNSDKSFFTFKRSGAIIFEYIFIKK